MRAGHIRCKFGRAGPPASLSSGVMPLHAYETSPRSIVCCVRSSAIAVGTGGHAVQHYISRLATSTSHRRPIGLCRAFRQCLHSFGLPRDIRCRLRAHLRDGRRQFADPGFSVQRCSRGLSSSDARFPGKWRDILLLLPDVGFDITPSAERVRRALVYGGRLWARDALCSGYPSARADIRSASRIRHRVYCGVLPPKVTEMTTTWPNFSVDRMAAGEVCLPIRAPSVRRHRSPPR